MALHYLVNDIALSCFQIIKGRKILYNIRQKYNIYMKNSENIAVAIIEIIYLLLS